MLGFRKNRNRSNGPAAEQTSFPRDESLLQNALAGLDPTGGMDLPHVDLPHIDVPDVSLPDLGDVDLGDSGVPLVIMLGGLVIAGIAGYKGYRALKRRAASRGPTATQPGPAGSS